MFDRGWSWSIWLVLWVFALAWGYGIQLIGHRFCEKEKLSPGVVPFVSFGPAAGFVVFFLNFMKEWGRWGFHGAWEAKNEALIFGGIAYVVVSLAFLKALGQGEVKAAEVSPRSKAVVLTGGHLFKMFKAENLGPWVTFTFQKREPEEGQAEGVTEEFRHHATVEDRGLVIGPPGTGKTAFLVAQLVDWMASGRSFVCTDVKPEIWGILQANGIFEKMGYTSIVFNPTGRCGQRYNFLKDLKSHSDLTELVASLFPVVGRGDTATFTLNARKIIEAVLVHLGDKASLPEARRFIVACGDSEEMLNYLRESKEDYARELASEVLASAGNDKLLSSIMTELTTRLGFLRNPDVAESLSVSDFSLQELLKPKVALFLQFEEKDKKSTEQLFGLMGSHVLRFLIEHQNREDVFLALDEIINSSPIPDFAAKMQTIRSRRLPTFLYLQNLVGLVDLYGPGADERFMSACDLQVVFRLNDNKTALLRCAVNTGHHDVRQRFSAAKIALQI